MRRRKPAAESRGSEIRARVQSADERAWRAAFITLVKTGEVLRALLSGSTTYRVPTRHEYQPSTPLPVRAASSDGRRNTCLKFTRGSLKSYPIEDPDTRQPRDTQSTLADVSEIVRLGRGVLKNVCKVVAPVDSITTSASRRPE